MSRTYTNLECDNPEHTDNPFSMQVVVTNGIAVCTCSTCGFHKEVDLNKKKSLAASQRPRSAFFISA